MSDSPTQEERRRSPSPGKQTRTPEDIKKTQEAQQKARAGIKKRAKKQSFLEKYSYQIVIGGFVALCAAALISFLLHDSRKLSEIPVIEETEIESHNKQGYSFQLGSNEFFESWTLANAKEIFKNSLSSKSTLPRCTTFDQDTSIIPDEYNFREKYADCATPIVNQQNCSSSYAIAGLSVLADRYCQQSSGEIKVTLSPQQILSCDKKNFACKGGSVNLVYDFARNEGIVEESCIPYIGEAGAECPQILDSCTRYQALDYCVTATEEGIKREILRNGPVVAVLPVYRDFLVYKKGIYEILEGTSKFHGGHIVKVIGWGKSNNVNYWIVENSWGETWGQNGLIYIKTGQKELYLEEFVLAVTPKVDKPEETTTDTTTTPGVKVTENTEDVNLDESENSNQ